MIQLDNISLSFDGKPLFEACSLAFHKEKTGIVGKNGSGKSSLLQIIAGTLSATSGAVQIQGTIGRIPQQTYDLASQSVAEVLEIAPLLNAWKRLEEGILDDADLETLDGHWDVQSRFENAMQKLGVQHISPESIFGELSGGERTKVLCARLVLHDFPIILLDEPTNHLDTEGREVLLRFIQNFQGCAVIVSHDRELLQHMDRIIEVEQGKVTTYGGNWTVYRQIKTEHREAAKRSLATARHALARTQKELQRTKERQEKRQNRARRDSKERGGIPKILLGARADRSERTESMLSKSAGRQMQLLQSSVTSARKLVPQERPLSIIMHSEDIPKGKTMLEAKNLTFSYEGKAILDNFSCSIHGGERVALRGNNGSGKSTLLQLFCGHLQASEGLLRCGVARDQIAYLRQHTDLLESDESVYEFFSRHHPIMDITKQRIILAEFLFPEAFLKRPVKALSGGEQTRLNLAIILSAEPIPSILLLDEPTNHMDIESIEVIENALLHYKGTIVAVSHDTTFLENIACNRTIAL